MTISESTREQMRQLASRYPQPRSALLPMLHLVQSVEHEVTAEGIEACAEILGITSAQVKAVSTFYTMYKRRPVGDYHVGVCTNTLCAIMGGDLIFERLKEHLDVGNDDMDDASSENIRILKLLAEDILQANRAQLRTLCEQLVECAKSDAVQT